MLARKDIAQSSRQHTQIARDREGENPLGKHSSRRLFLRRAKAQVRFRLACKPEVRVFDAQTTETLHEWIPPTPAHLNSALQLAVSRSVLALVIFFGNTP